jgi:hypothetical protein
VKIDAARRALAMARTLDEVKDIRNKAAAVAHYLRQQQSSLEAQNIAADLKLRAERKLGELLAEQQPKANRPRLHDGTLAPGQTLPDGINKTQSHRWQLIARLPEQDFEHHLATTREAGDEITTNGVLRLAQDHVRTTTRQQRRNPAPAARPSVALGDRWRIDCADCLDWFRAQPADSLDLVFGSPPYADARLYLEDGSDPGIARGTEEWVAWMVEVYEAALRCCTGLVAFVVGGRTENYCWSAAPALLIADLRRKGIVLRNAPVFQRVGIPGSGGPDWLRSDHEWIVCATRGGPLPWSDNTAMGKPCKYGAGGKPSHRVQDGRRVNQEYIEVDATQEERANVGPHRARMKARRRAGKGYVPPEVANPGTVIDCGAVGGGNMGDPLCHENEAPFPESLAEFFVRSWCPRGGVVADCFCGSATTAKVALQHGRLFRGCDIRPSQVELSRRRITEAADAPRPA